MIVKSITYKNFNGETVSEDLYFHVRRDEMLDMDTKYPEGVEKHLLDIKARNDNTEFFRFLRDAILMGYGRKTEDGSSFVKPSENTESFRQSAAFEALMDELMDGSEDELVSFVGGLFAGKSKEVEASETKNRKSK